MHYLTKSAVVGCAGTVVGLAAYWLTDINHSESIAVAAAMVCGATLASLCEVVWKRHLETETRAWIRKHDKAVEKRQFERLNKKYILLERGKGRGYDRNGEVHRLFQTFADDEPEEKAEPVRKLGGALAEDFANAPEEIKREIFG